MYAGTGKGVADPVKDGFSCRRARCKPESTLRTDGNGVGHRFHAVLLDDGHASFEDVRDGRRWVYGTNADSRKYSVWRCRSQVSRKHATH